MKSDRPTGNVPSPTRCTCANWKAAVWSCLNSKFQQFFVGLAARLCARHAWGDAQLCWFMIMAVRTGTEPQAQPEQALHPIDFHIEIYR